MAIMRGCDGSIKMGTKLMGYIDSFNININVGNAETSSIGKEWKEYMETVKDWGGSASGTFDYSTESGQKDIIDRILASGKSTTPLAGEFKVAEDLTLTGNFCMSSAALQSAFGDKVSISFNFQGTGKIEKATT